MNLEKYRIGASFYNYDCVRSILIKIDDHSEYFKYWIKNDIGTIYAVKVDGKCNHNPEHTSLDIIGRWKYRWFYKIIKKIKKVWSDIW